jgi:hypothetical protein
MSSRKVRSKAGEFAMLVAPWNSCRGQQ